MFFSGPPGRIRGCEYLFCVNYEEAPDPSNPATLILQQLTYQPLTSSKESLSHEILLIGKFTFFTVLRETFQASVSGTV